MFVKYISDRAHGGEQGSYEAARALRDEILARLKEGSARDVIAEYQQRYARVPRGR